MINGKYGIENSGENSGVLVANNSGNIYVDLQKVVKIPSLISGLIKSLGNACVEEVYSTGEVDMNEYKPDDKIEYNGVIAYRDIIKEFAAYYLTCENYLNAYDDSNIGGKAKILRCVHMWYLYAKGEMLLENSDTEKSEIEIIRVHSDRIIDLVRERVLRVIRESGEMENIYQEDLELGITCFLCYCFMECKILEKPL